MSHPNSEPPSRPTVVISGAGIAGPALAFWLTSTDTAWWSSKPHRASGRVARPWTCAARVATWSNAWVCIGEMKKRALIQRGAAWVSADGSRRAEMPVEAFDGNGLVSKLEILRGDLVDVLYRRHQGARRIPLQHPHFEN